MNQEQIGNFIAAMRKEKELTQAQLAKKLGVSNKTVSRWETGKNIILAGVTIWLAAMLFLTLGLSYFEGTSTQIEINKDVSKYHDYIGQDALADYRNKCDMDESIFPAQITENMHVSDYEMVYYNPWDPQYLSYLVVNYDETMWKAELSRLKNYSSTEYLGYYSVTGFQKYELLAVYADDYHGFVYALADHNSQQIIYVEIIFCNYFMDIDYNKYIPSKYLPDGFDATVDNAYRHEKMQ